MRVAIITTLIIIIAVLASAYIWFLFACEDDWCFIFQWQKVRATNTFEDCLAREFPVTDSFPRQCRAGTKIFTETILPEEQTTIRALNVKPNDVIQSPLTLIGQAPGPWYFEASFSVSVVDANGQLLGRGIAQAQGEWMTTEFVTFQAPLTFSTPTTPAGFLIFEKNNASGLAEHDAQVRIPVGFNPAS